VLSAVSSVTCAQQCIPSLGPGLIVYDFKLAYNEQDPIERVFYRLTFWTPSLEWRSIQFHLFGIITCQMWAISGEYVQQTR